MIPQSISRFYKSVDTDRTEDGYLVRLDGRPLRTPMETPLLLPNKRLAAVIAKEWNEQEETVNLLSMAMTGFANTAIARVAPRRKEVIDGLIAYAETDLVCYRAKEPAELVNLQARAWQPHLDWLEGTYGAKLLTTKGIIHLKQNRTTLDVIRRVLASRNDFTLTGVHVMTAAMGSLVLSLAVADGVLDARRAAAAGQLDEIFQAKYWGEDEEAISRRKRIAQEVALVERFLGLLFSES